MLFSDKNVNILVIDDDPSLLRQISFRLKKRDGYVVFEAENGLNGLTKARKHKPDLIILDWMLPDIQGPEVLTELKSDPQTSTIPVLMLTGKNKIGEIEQAFDLGADAYLTKPFSLQNMADKVADLLK
ncbi:MAG: response regulator [Gammaproteobacteria bacterium]|nr:response regulator [Gammaproteobacteria bacterium]